MTTREWGLASIALACALLLLPGCNSGTSTGSSDTGKSGGAEIIGNVSEDSKIEKAVEDRLEADAALKGAGIKAKVSGAQVELTGTVKKVEDKDKAESLTLEAIKGFSNVNAGVLNNIMIAESDSGGEAGDATKGNTTSSPAPGKK